MLSGFRWLSNASCVTIESSHGKMRLRLADRPFSDDKVSANRHRESDVHGSVVDCFCQVVNHELPRSMVATSAANSVLAVRHREISKKRQKIAHVFTGVALLGFSSNLTTATQRNERKLDERKKLDVPNLVLCSCCAIICVLIFN